MAVRGKVLVVDDDANMRETIRDNLEVAGFEVMQAASGAEALAAVTKSFFDVILMDYQLPDATGIDVIRQIRRLNTESQIVMFTAHASVDTAVKAIQESVSDFLSKPIDFERLIHAINNAILKLRLEQENRRLLADLKKANEQLTKLSQMKSKFMSMASHDLSNALMTVQASIDMLSTSLAKPTEDQKKRLNYVATGIKQIARLTNDLVDWASIEQGKFRLEMSSFAPASILEEIVTGQEARAKMREIKLSYKVAKDIPPVQADSKRLSQVVNNLLENAIRHTPKGGNIAIDVSLKNDAIQWMVKDSGQGIAKEELGKIFQSFYQGSDRESAGRLGLGLSIAKEIVEAHHGRLWAESPGIGKGASFLFTIPVTQK